MQTMSSNNKIRESRSAKSAKNLLYGVVSQGVTVLLTFIIRIVLVRQAGILSVSLNGLFTEVITMLSLAELGVGSAIVYSLYKPLAEHNEKKIVKLMNMYKTAYRNIALAIFGMGLCLLPFIQHIVTKVDVSDNYIRFVFLLFLTQTASSYLFSYKSSLLNADQNVYIVSKITTVVRLVGEIINMICLAVFHNYIIYLVVEILITVSVNVIISGQVDKMYPFLKRKDELLNVEKRMIFKNMKNIFIGNLSGRITNSTDNILISILVSTYEVGIYTGYSTLASGLRKIIDQLDRATAGSVGNLMAEGNAQKCDEVLKKMTFINYFFGSLFACLLYCLSSTLVRIMYGEEYTYNTNSMIGLFVIFVFSINFFLSVLKNPLWRFMQVSGLFAKDKNISIAGSAANLIISVIFGIKLGTLGILIGTIATLLIQMVLKIRLLYKESFKISSVKFYLRCIIYGFFGIFSMLLAKFICAEIISGNLYIDFVLKMIIAAFVPLCINYIIFCRTKEYAYMKDILWKYAYKIWKLAEPICNKRKAFFGRFKERSGRQIKNKKAEM